MKDAQKTVVGNTPYVSLLSFERAMGLSASLFAKLEWENPAGSVKDRVAWEMLKDFDERGLLKSDAVIVEPTSGNTGIGLAAACRARGLRALIVLPENMSVERREAIASFGGELVLTPAALGMRGAIDRAEELCRTVSNALLAGQFTNPANPRAHYRTTGPELWHQSEGKIDVLVCGVGTGGTITGTARYLKEQNPDLFVVAVEPAESAVLSGKSAGPHALQGIGAGFVPEVLDVTVYDEVLAVTKDEAYTACRELRKHTPYAIGISAGAALAAAVQVAKREAFYQRHIGVIFPDSAERYRSTDLFTQEELSK